MRAALSWCLSRWRALHEALGLLPPSSARLSSRVAEGARLSSSAGRAFGSVTRSSGSGRVRGRDRDRGSRVRVTG